MLSLHFLLPPSIPRRRIILPAEEEKEEQNECTVQRSSSLAWDEYMKVAMHVLYVCV